MQSGRRYFLLGICGAGMSSLALLLQSLGMQVRGTDAQDQDFRAQSLGSHGIAVLSENEGAASIESDEIVVRSSAILSGNPVLEAAVRAGSTILHRTEVLSTVASRYFLIAVAGTHGKTTTSGMIGYVLANQGKEPAICVGGRIVGFDRCFPKDHQLQNGVKGRPIMVLETDESDGSFLRFRADVAVVTNIDHDHLGTYDGSFDNLVCAFKQFAAQCEGRGGTVIGCGDDPNVRAMTACVRRHVLYGHDTANSVRVQYISSSNSVIIHDESTELLFKMTRGDEKSYDNAVAAALACEATGVEFRRALSVLETFPGMERRMEVLGEWRGITILTDHADHPTEIRATLQALAVRYPRRKLTLVLQPHRYTRVRACLEGYGQALVGADKVMLLDIFPAGEATERPEDLNAKLRASVGAALGTTLEDLSDDRAILASLLRTAVEGDVVVFVGPGDVNKLGLQFCGLLSNSNAVV